MYNLLVPAHVQQLEGSRPTVDHPNYLPFNRPRGDSPNYIDQGGPGALAVAFDARKSLFSMQQPSSAARTSLMDTNYALPSELDDMVSYLFYHQNVQPESQTTTLLPRISSDQIFSAFGGPLSATFNDNHLSQMGMEQLGIHDDQPRIFLSPTPTRRPLNDIDLSLQRIATASGYAGDLLLSDSSNPEVADTHCARPIEALRSEMHGLEVTHSSTSDAPPAQLFHPSGSTIPQRRYQSQTSKKPAGTTTITFAMESGDGFSIKDALNKKYTGLVDRDDEILALQGSSSISIRIEWPGYGSWNRQNPQPIPRSKLGTEVAKSLKLFINEMHSKRVKPSHRFWQVGPIGSPRINTDKLVLVALDQVARASWQPVFCLVD